MPWSLMVCVELVCWVNSLTVGILWEDPNTGKPTKIMPLFHSISTDREELQYVCIPLATYFFTHTPFHYRRT